MAKGKSNKVTVNNKPLAKKSLDEFLSTWSDDDDDEEGSEPQEVVNGLSKKNLSKKKPNETSKDSKIERKREPSTSEEDDSDISGLEDGDDDENEEDFGSDAEIEEDEDEDLDDEGNDEESDDEDVGSGATQQKRYLASLKDKDPEFFKFLKENDAELLQFNESSSDEEDVADQEEEEETLHKLPAALEVASDESDFEVDEDHETSGGKAKNIITKKMIDAWSQQLADKPGISNIADVVAAFRSAVATIGGPQTDQEQEAANSKGKNKKAPSKVPVGKYVVEGSTMFNAVVRLCLTSIPTAFSKVLNLGPESSRKAMQPKKSKQWPKLKKHVKQYTSDLVTLMQSLTGNVQGALLKHVQSIVPYFLAVPKNAKLIIRCLIQQWSSANEESVRVLAFLGLLRIARMTMAKQAAKGGGPDVDFKDDDDDSASHLEPILKQMYMSFVQNVKFTSPSTWPMIHFMRRSLSEMFKLCQETTYRFAFIYIRQLAIHLRNAMIQNNKTKDSALDSVYNWQFVHCCHLWTQLLSDSHPSESLEPLIYPLVQVISGAIRLVYTPKYYPLRFHLCSQLIQVSSFTKKFIPILPYYLDILNMYNFGKKSSKLSMKPLDFSCCLKVSKSELMENGFKDTTVEQIYCGIFEYLHTLSHKISFPEMVVPLTFQLKAFLKKCSVSNYTKKFKQILDKTNENGKFIMDKRRKVTFGVRDKSEIQAWEESIRVSGTPISQFYTSFKKVKEAEQMKTMMQGDNLDDYDFIPKLDKKSKTKKSTEDQEFKGLLGDDDSNDDDIDDVERFKLKEEREKKASRKRKNLDSDISSDDDDDDGELEAKSRKGKKAKKSAAPPQPTPLDSDEVDDEGDQVEELNLEEFVSEDEDEVEDESVGDDISSEEDEDD